MNKKLVSIICCIPLTINLGYIQKTLKGETIIDVNIKNYKNKKEIYNELEEYAEYVVAERKRKEEEEKRRAIEEENRRREEEERKILEFPISRGLSLNYKKVTCHITYYTNENSRLQGGYNDKIGKPLLSHGVPIAAAPSDVPYGSYLILNEEVRGAKEYKIVDTGGAIKWIDNNTMKVDIFIPNVSTEWLNAGNVQNKTITGILYYK